MRAVKERLRLALKVTPRLLGDTLARALRAEGVEVVVVSEGDADPANFDVAVVTDGTPCDIDAPLVIWLPSERGQGVGSVQHRGHPKVRTPLTDVGSILAALDLDDATRARQGQHEG